MYQLLSVNAQKEIGLCYPAHAKKDIRHETRKAENGILFVLSFYGPVNPMGSCQTRSVYLITFYWTGLFLKAVN